MFNKMYNEQNRLNVQCNDHKNIHKNITTELLQWREFKLGYSILGTCMLNVTITDRNNGLL